MAGLWSGSQGRTGLGPPRRRKVFFESQRYKGPQQPVRFISTSARDLERQLAISLASRDRGSAATVVAGGAGRSIRPVTVGGGASMRSPPRAAPARFVNGQWTVPRPSRARAPPLLHSLRGQATQAGGGMALEYRPAGPRI